MNKKSFIFAVLSLIVFWGDRLNAFTFSWEKIYEKLEKPLPEWMQEQIKEDLEPFYERGVTVENIEATMRDVYEIPSGRQVGFVHYQIRNNRISISSPSESPDDARIAHVVEVLNDLAQHLPLPDVDFLTALWDSYDNPLCLEKTQCPVFTICKLQNNRCGVLFPEFRHFSYRQRLIDDIKATSEATRWETKIEQAFWRGMTSGWNYTLYDWDMRPRSRLVMLSKLRPDLVDASFTSAFSIDRIIEDIMNEYKMFSSWSYPIAFVKYKYLVSVDGNTFASNFWWQLLSNSTVMKMDSDYVEWFYKGVVPYEHYLPFSFDLCGFEKKVDWLRTYDGEAKEIAERGRLFALEHLSNESLAVYFYRLLQAYAALQR